MLQLYSKHRQLSSRTQIYLQCYRNHESIGTNSIEDAQTSSSLDIVITLRDIKEVLKHGEASHSLEPENSICLLFSLN